MSYKYYNSVWSVSVGAYRVWRHHLSKISYLSVKIMKTVLLCCNRIITPWSLQQWIVIITLEGHQGIIKTEKLLHKKVWFPQIDCLVESKVKSCFATYTWSLIRTAKDDWATSPAWSEISINFAGPFLSGEYLLVVIDAYSRFPEIS